MSRSQKIPVYFVPGLAANPRIFDYITLPDSYEKVLIEWLTPIDTDETIEDYAKRMAMQVKNPDGILIGVSFGGVMVQEMKAFLNPKKVIIISSIKSRQEMPRRMYFSQKTNAHKIIPNITHDDIEKFEKYIITDWGKKKLELYKNFFNVRDKKYLPWSFHTIMNWNRTDPDPEIIHIHGTSDGVFPYKYIKNCIEIPKGTHIMILNKAKQINKILERILNE